MRSMLNEDSRRKGMKSKVVRVDHLPVKPLAAKRVSQSSRHSTTNKQTNQKQLADMKGTGHERSEAEMQLLMAERSQGRAAGSDSEQATGRPAASSKQVDFRGFPRCGQKKCVP
jgi:hypothetical protein